MRISKNHKMDLVDFHLTTKTPLDETRSSVRGKASHRLTPPHTKISLLNFTITSYRFILTLSSLRPPHPQSLNKGEVWCVFGEMSIELMFFRPISRGGVREGWAPKGRSPSSRAWAVKCVRGEAPNTRTRTNRMTNLGRIIADPTHLKTFFWKSWSYKIFFGEDENF